jgi:hypothetical protein
MEQVSKGTFDKSHYFRMYSTLFQIAGSVREAQVNRNLLARSDPKEELTYHDYLCDVERKSKTQLLEEANKFDPVKLDILNDNLHFKANQLSDKAIRKEATRYIRKHLQTVIRLLDEHQNLHRVRKFVKTLYDLLIYTGQHDSSNLGPVMHRLNGLIGKWHDAKVLVDSIRQFMHQRNPAERHAYEQLIQQVNSDLKRKENEIHLFVKDSFKPEIISTGSVGLQTA